MLFLFTQKVCLLILTIFIISSVVASEIKLSSVDVNFSNDWSFDKKNFIYIYTYDLNKTSVDVNNIIIEIMNFSGNYTANKLFRSSVGSYYKSFVLNKTENVSMLFFNITVIDNLKNINSFYNVSIITQNDYQKLKSTIKDYFSNAWDFTKEYWLPIIIVTFSVLSFIVFIDLFLRGKKNE